MATHVHHPSLPDYREGAMLQDGCPECERRATNLRELLHMDEERMARLWNIMLDRNYGGGEGAEPDPHRGPRCGHALHGGGTPAALLQRRPVASARRADALRPATRPAAMNDRELTTLQETGEVRFSGRVSLSTILAGLDTLGIPARAVQLRVAAPNIVVSVDEAEAEASMADDPSFVEWVRGRPESVQRLLRQWPPGTQVKAREGRELVVPAPGMVGRVVSWTEDGDLGVVAEGGGSIRATCDPEWLEAIGYPSVTPAQIATILDEQSDQPDQRSDDG